MEDHVNQERRKFLRTATITGAALVTGLSEPLTKSVSIAASPQSTKKPFASGQPDGLRDFIRLLKKNGELISVKKEVDPRFDLAGYLWDYEEKQKAVLFEKVRGSAMPVVGGLFQDWRRIGFSLGVSSPKFGQKEMYKMFLSAMSKPIPPRAVDAAPVKEMVLKGERVDLAKLPVPTLFEGDAGPYITAGVGICKDPETNTYNIGVYRMQVTGRDKILVWAFPGSDLSSIYKAYERMGKEMDFAVAIGVDPAILMTAVSKVPSDIDEFAVAGALKGRAVTVTPGATVDLLIPANAEIVIEGKIDPEARTVDGPFADHGGIYKGGPSPALRVSAVLHRKNPLFHVILSGDSLEHCTLSEILACFWGRNILDHLQSKFKSVEDVHLSWHGGTKKWAMVCLSSKNRPEEPQEIITEVFGLASPRYRMVPVSTFLRSVVVVDSDVDIYKPKDVIWAVGTRLANATLLPEEKAKGFEARLGLDATKPIGAPPDQYKRVRTKKITG